MAGPSRDLSERLLADSAASLPAARSVDAAEVALIEQLPDLMGRIQRLGLLEEYGAFKNSYTAWRRGKARGAKGEMTHDHISRPEHLAANRSLSFRAPNLQEWLWRRTISYWICVSFFEGSVFFTVSSILGNCEAQLGPIYKPLYVFGYVAGKVCFFVGCYFMCLEVINMEVSAEDEEIFYFWPYRYKIAVDKLRTTGSDCLPYICGSVYLTGVLVLTVGVSTEVIPMSEVVAVPLKAYTFLVGSSLFGLGGAAECIQNRIFTGAWTEATTAALLNFLGGVLFTAGAVSGYYGDGHGCNTFFAYGSFLYAVASSVQMKMWKDEQFGLTFLSGMNKLQHPGAVNILVGGESEEDTKASFSTRGLVLVHVFCWCGAMSTYNGLVDLARFINSGTLRDFQYAFNEWLPCLFVHLMLVMSSAVLRVPKFAPFRQLFLFARVLGVCLAINSSFTFWLFINREITH